METANITFEISTSFFFHQCDEFFVDTFLGSVTIAVEYRQLLNDFLYGSDMTITTTTTPTTSDSATTTTTTTTSKLVFELLSHII